MVLESTVSIAKVGTKSLRATVPEGIVSYLDIQAGDKLEWRMEVDDSERIAIVTKKGFNKNAEKIALKYAKVKRDN